MPRMWGEGRARGIGFRIQVELWTLEKGTTVRRAPSPRSWPRICSCKCFGWLDKVEPGEVRPAAERFRRGREHYGDQLQRAPTGFRLIFSPCSNVPHLTRPRFARPPRAFARANAGPASWRGIRAAPSRLTQDLYRRSWFHGEGSARPTLLTTTTLKNTNTPGGNS